MKNLVMLKILGGGYYPLNQSRKEERTGLICLVPSPRPSEIGGLRRNPSDQRRAE